MGAVSGGVVGLVVLPAAPDDQEPGSGEDAGGVRVVFPSVAAFQYRSAAQGFAWCESPAKSMTAPRSCLSTAQRKPTTVTLPDCLVEGVAPARLVIA